MPLFPAPPTLDGAPAPASNRNATDVDDDGITTTPTPTDNPSRVSRHVTSSSSPGKIVRNSSSTGNNNHHSRRRSHRVGRFVNVVHPKLNSRESGRARARITELRVKMTERRDDEEDDADVVCASGKYLLKII